MKTVFAVVSLGLGLLSAPLGSSAATLNLTFNGSDTYTPSFNAGVNGAGTATFAYSATGGILDVGGSAGGGIIVPANAQLDESTVFKAQSFDLTTGTATISEFVKYIPNATVGDKALQLGFVNGPNGLFNSNAGIQFLSARILGNSTAEFQFRDATTTTAGTNVAFGAGFASGDWIRLTLTLTLTNAATGSINYGFTIDDFGASGTAASPVNLVTLTNQTLVNASFSGTALSTYYAGFRTATSSTAAQAFDNLAVTTNVPEPTALGLVAVGALTLARRRRQV